jgi:hypothetical protein
MSCDTEETHRSSKQTRRALLPSSGGLSYDMTMRQTRLTADRRERRRIRELVGLDEGRAIREIFREESRRGKNGSGRQVKVYR